MTENSEAQGKRSRIDVAKTTELHLELDDEKIAAIKNCLAKGKLSIRVSDADFSLGGRLDAIYTYD